VWQKGRNFFPSIGGGKSTKEKQMKIQKPNPNQDLLNIAKNAGKIINHRDAIKLVAVALDAGKLTRDEIETLEDIRTRYKFSKPAARVLKEAIEEAPKTRTALELMVERKNAKNASA